MTNTTFVLGAGFSADAGFPLLRDLRERVLSFIEFDRHPSYRVFLEPGNGGFDEGQFYAGLKELDPTGGLQFEELITRLRTQLGTPNYAGPGYITQRVLRIGCSRLFWCIHGLNPFPESSYRNFGSWLIREAATFRDRNTLVSFHWDLVAETALTEAGIYWTYSSSVRSDVSVLKPHGSINWSGYLRENLRNDSGLWEPIGSGSRLSYMAKSPLKNPDQQRINPDLDYVLFPGDPELPQQDEDLGRIWRDIETALSDSDRVVFIGYSLPDYDSFAADFFRSHVGRKVEVYNPSDQDRQKYRNLFGDRVVREEGTFSSCPYAKG